MSRKVFEVLHADAKKDGSSMLTSDQTWEFLKKLNLATEMEDGSLYIPSLIPAKNEGKIKKAFEKMKKSEHSLGFRISLQKSDRVTDIYSNLLCRLASKEFFYQQKYSGISFEVSFASKIENRKLGLVAGTKGSFSLKRKEGDKTPVDFLIAEVDCDNSTKEWKFARNKVNRSSNLRFDRNDFFPGHLHLS